MKWVPHMLDILQTHRLVTLRLFRTFKVRYKLIISIPPNSYVPDYSFLPTRVASFTQPLEVY